MRTEPGLSATLLIQKRSHFFCHGLIFSSYKKSNMLTVGIDLRSVIMNYLITFFTLAFITLSPLSASQQVGGVDPELAKDVRHAIFTEVILGKNLPPEISAAAMRTAVMNGGFVDPKTFDNPEFADDHEAAFQWLMTFVQEGQAPNYDALTALANEFQAKTGQGEAIGGQARQDKLAKKLGKYGLGGDLGAAISGAVGAGEIPLGWSESLNNYKEKIKTCLNPNAKICDVSLMASRGTVKKFNIHIVNLASAYIKALQPFVQHRMDEMLGKH